MLSKNGVAFSLLFLFYSHVDVQFVDIIFFGW